MDQQDLSRRERTGCECRTAAPVCRSTPRMCCFFAGQNTCMLVFFFLAPGRDKRCFLALPMPFLASIQRVTLLCGLARIQQKCHRARAKKKAALRTTIASTRNDHYWCPTRHLLNGTPTCRCSAPGRGQRTEHALPSPSTPPGWVGMGNNHHSAARPTRGY